MNNPDYYSKFNKHIVEFLILLFLPSVLFLIAHLFQEPPQERRIHVENFRYGKEPAVIRCNRGDTLRITLSSRDTGHSFFIQEFDIDAKINAGNNQILKFQTSDPTAPHTITDEIIIIAEHPGILKYLVSKSSIRCHVWCGPMHAFEHGYLIIAPNTLLFVGIGLLLAIVAIGLCRAKRGEVDLNRGAEDGIDLFHRFPGLKTWLQKRWLQPTIMLIGAAFLYLVILITILGTQMAGRNLGVLLIWIVWLFLLIVMLTPFGGRVWCMICPIPLAGEVLQRRSLIDVKFGSTNNYRNKLYGLQKKWPKALDNGWLRLFFFLLLGTFSTTLSVHPATTGLAIVLLIVMSIVLALIFEHRSFCRYICPINSFIALYAKTGKLALRQADADVCDQCKADYCERGSKGGYPCPYGLNIKNVKDNYDCGMCTECLKSCLYDNVTLRWRKFACETVITKVSTAWTAMVLLVVVCAYSIVYLGPWAKVRDFVNIIDKGNWDLFAIYGLLLWSSALVIFPLILYVVSALSKKLSGVKTKAFDILIAISGSLIPLSLTIWIAFVVQMLFVNMTFIFQALSDPLGWGWNLLGQAGTPWVQFVPRLIPWIQVGLVLFGFFYTFRNSWRIWNHLTTDNKQAFRGFLPLVFIHFLIAMAFINFYAN